MMNLFVPLSEMFSAGVFQADVLRPELCCNVKPVEVDGHEMIT